MYLLDTNVVSELRKTKPHGGLLSWINGAENDALFLSAVTLGELQAGVEITRDQDPDKAAQIERWIDQLAQTWNILPMDSRAFRYWAALMHGKSDALMEDAMIAATALVHGLVVVTRNVRDFKAFDVATLNPFSPSSRER
jgi:toxin FitB